MNETHDHVIKEKNLPRVGQSVRRKLDGTLWRVIEKREVYQRTVDDQLLPAIQLTYWREQPGQLQGIGEMYGQAYTLHDNLFESNWEIT